MPLSQMHDKLHTTFLLSRDEDPIESRKRSRLRRPRGLPPVTPNACVRDAVCSLVFEQVWGELAAVLQPLVAAVREMEDKGRCRYDLLHFPAILQVFRISTAMRCKYNGTCPRLIVVQLIPTYARNL